MARIAKFYERLPKGSAPEFKSSGPMGWYRDRYFGKDPSAARKKSPEVFHAEEDVALAGSRCSILNQPAPSGLLRWERSFE